MPIRTIPTNFPLLRERDYYTRRLARGGLIRDLAKAQNYLWAKSSRVYAACSYEGHGFEDSGATARAANVLISPFRQALPSDLTITNAVRMCAFLAPPNWGPSQRIKVQGQVNFTKIDTGTMKITVLVCELNGSYTGESKTITVSTTGDNDWSTVLTTNRYRTQEVHVYVHSITGNIGTNYSKAKLNYVSARYQTGDSTEMGGDAPNLTWKPMSHAASQEDYPMDSAILVNLVRDTNSLYAARGCPELCQSWLARNYINSAGFQTTGIYKVWVPSRVTSIKGKITYYSTHGGAGNSIRVLWNGVVKQTFSALAAGATTTVDVTAFAVTEGAEGTLSVEAESTAAAGNWGVITLGVHFWEEAVTLALPGGTTVPADYQPLDEDYLGADRTITFDLTGTVRTGIKKLFENNTWLAHNRLRWLISDWRHRTLKRVDTDTPVGTGTNIYPFWDWTRGPEDTENQIYMPKNITVVGTDTTKDGLGAWPRGLSSTGAATVNNWPGPQAYLIDGLRVGLVRTNIPATVSAINGITNSRARVWFRGRRLRPFALGTGFDSGTEGPLVEDEAFKNRGYFSTNIGGSDTCQLYLDGSRASDTEPHWPASKTLLHSALGETSNIVGRCEHKPGGYVKNPLEGNLFEMELQAVCIYDEPLTQTEIDALA